MGSTESTPFFGPLGATGCAPSSPGNGVEFQGAPADDTTIAYGTFQSGSPDTLHTSLSNGETVKFVLRMTGTGDLAAVVRSSTGVERGIDWGPEPHTLGSNYNRPGDEWGIGFSVDSPGCWELVLTRAEQGAASFFFQVP